MTSVTVSNALAVPMTIWIEPWCDELVLPSRAEAAFRSVRAGVAPPELEIVDETLVVWAGGPGTMIVLVDNVEQDTGSRTIDLNPAMFEMPVKTFVQTVFGNQPGARPAGVAAPKKH
ncbi:hypothetical protein NF700_15760 [Sphingomonadaceae bacterium OTU29MARTA1]|nr:hypothetical protein NF700_15760 [Sphingomonadaceae bacterium OTU29MARTA1]